MPGNAKGQLKKDKDARTKPANMLIVITTDNNRNNRKRIMRTVAFLILLSSLPLLSGCTEEDKANAKELWLGTPNPTPPKLAVFKVDKNDGPLVLEYKEIYGESFDKAYRKLTTKTSQRIFIQEMESRARKDINILAMRDAGHISDREAAIMMSNAAQQNQLESEIRSLNRTLDFRMR